MNRLLVAFAAGMIALGLTIIFAPQSAFAETTTLDASAPLAQADWGARKQSVTLGNGLRLAYVELGDPAGAPVLLLHGFTDSSRVWSILAPYLTRHRLLIPDQRGHGASDAPACCYAPSDFAEDARLFLDALGVPRAAVVGHSLGSMAGQHLAAEHPERVERLVLIGSTALAPVRRGDWLWGQITALREPVAANAAFLREWSPGASPTPVDAEFVRHSDAEMVRVPLHVWRAVPRALVDLPVARHAADVTAPVLILSAGADALFPPGHHRALVAAYPGAEAEVFAGLGHNLVVERPERIGPRLAAFLAKGAAPVR